LGGGSMHHEIGITADRTREMRVIGFGETVMSERLRSVTRSLQAFEQTDLKRLLFRLAANRREKALDFFALRQIADLVTEAENEFPIFAKLFRIRILMNPEDRGNRPVPQLAGDGFVCREHEFFD